MKVSVIAKGKRARASVFRGTKAKTQSGLKASDLTKNKTGKIVSKKASAAATKAARKALNIKGFVPVGGKSAAGQALLKKARSLYKK